MQSLIFFKVQPATTVKYQRSEDVTSAQHQRPKSATGTLTWHASKYKLHKLHQGYILFGLLLGSCDCF